MSQPTQLRPQIDWSPMHGAIAQNQPTTLDVLIRITPPQRERSTDRAPLNLGLVIDRSGSMHGAKLEAAKQAACYAVEQLLPCDRISVTLFDTQVETLVMSTLATDKAAILAKIRNIRDGSSTALHAGWVQGGMQVSHYLNPEHINRVLLLSDGLANVGETNPDAIANDVHGLAQRGIATTTLGLGDDYSEDLLESMARSGDGNFYHIQSPSQLPDIFQTELQGLLSTIGHHVSLGIEPQAGVTIMDILNDFDKTPSGRLKLPNLVMGNVINIVLRLRIPAQAATTNLCQVRLAWNDLDCPERQTEWSTLTLPVVSLAQLNDFPANSEVQEQVAILMAARARQEAIHKADQGDLAGAAISLRTVREVFNALPASAPAMAEMTKLEELAQGFEEGDTLGTRKKALSQRFHLQRGRTSDGKSGSV